MPQSYRRRRRCIHGIARGPENMSRQTHYEWSGDPRFSRRGLPPCFGFNSLFDEEFLRQAFYQCSSGIPDQHEPKRSAGRSQSHGAAGTLHPRHPSGLAQRRGVHKLGRSPSPRHRAQGTRPGHDVDATLDYCDWFGAAHPNCVGFSRFSSKTSVVDFVRDERLSPTSISTASRASCTS